MGVCVGEVVLLPNRKQGRWLGLAQAFKTALSQELPRSCMGTTRIYPEDSAVS
jgi:hypothetical protein